MDGLREIEEIDKIEASEKPKVFETSEEPEGVKERVEAEL